MISKATFVTLTLLIASISVEGCTMENGYDVYIEGLKILGDAERRDCQLGYDSAAQNAVINSDRVLNCLEANQSALKKFEHAVELGHKGHDVDTTLKDTKRRIERLESMLRTIKKMEMQSLQDKVDGKP